jgi:hypothetical protein
MLSIFPKILVSPFLLVWHSHWLRYYIQDSRDTGFTFPMISSQSDFRHSLHLSSVIMSIFPHMWSKISCMYFLGYDLHLLWDMFLLSPWICSSSYADMIFTFPQSRSCLTSGMVFILLNMVFSSFHSLPASFLR